jgi:hypothetical protein
VQAIRIALPIADVCERLAQRHGVDLAMPN